MRIFFFTFLASFFFFHIQAQTKADSARLMQDVKNLSSNKMQGRKTGTQGNRKAQVYIENRFKTIGLKQLYHTYEQSFFFTDEGKRVMGTNLMGYIEGKTDSWIVLSAHYDHLGIAEKAINGDSVYNGADDNASGVAGLLAMAAYFKDHPPRHNLLFIAFDGEEEGLQGSKAFVAHSDSLLKKIKLNINMDMISHSTKRELYACGTYQFPRLKPYLENAAKESKIKLLFGHDKPEDGHDNWVNQSDQGSFYAAGIPFIYFGVEDHPDYHQVSDEFSTITPSFFYHAVETILQATKNLDRNLGVELNIPPRSKWIMEK